MVRQIRHYVGSVGLLYYIEPKLKNKRSSAADFAKAVQLLTDRATFKNQVDKVFDEMDSQQVYLARCEKAEAAVAESILIDEWRPLNNERHEGARARVTSPVTVIHRPGPPGTL
jgi:hypothetical protein